MSRDIVIDFVDFFLWSLIFPRHGTIDTSNLEYSLDTVKKQATTWLWSSIAEHLVRMEKTLAKFNPKYKKI